MALSDGRYFIHDKLTVTAPHHESFRQLWETKWKAPAEMGVYPFMFGTAKDFEPLVQEMEEKGMCEPYDWDTYAETFFPYAERLVRIAQDAEAAGEPEKASEYYL